MFAGLSFVLAAGKGALLTGPNGTGKTTLLRAIAGLGELNGGRLHLTGGDDDLQIPQQSHYVAHANALKPALGVAENLQFWAKFMGETPSYIRVLDALETFGLDRLAPFSSALLSAGQKRRLALARLQLIPRPIWLLDEPSVGLDKQSIALLASAMQRHLEGGGLLIASTHADLTLPFSQNIDMGDYPGLSQ